ncbi:MAG: hypothetical protein WAV16_03300 [Candidatus Moraniibacteriota bacterium]
MSKKFTFGERIKQDILLLTVSDDFMLDVEKMNKKYNLPVQAKDRDSEGVALISNDKNFNKDFDKLRKKYNIPESHTMALGIFLETKDINFNDDSFYNLIHLNPWTKLQEKENCVMLKIYPDTTRKDIQNNWHRIKIARDKLLNRDIIKKVRIENLERDIEILNLKRSGKSAKEIAFLINKDKRFKKITLGYVDIPKIIQRLKNMAKRNMARKKS